MRKKPLKMRKLSNKELGPFRLNLVSMLAGSPDPCISVMYSIDIEPLKKMVRDFRAQHGQRISLTPIFNKMIGMVIAEMPIFNQIVLGGSVYQLEEVHIANAFLLPGPEQALIFIVTENPHQKTVLEITEEFKTLMEEKTREYEKLKNSFAARLLRLYFRLGLYRLVTDKLAFTIGYRQGLISNITFIHNVFNKPTTYVVVKPIISPFKSGVRLMANPNINFPVVENGSVSTKEHILLMLTADHRVVHGIHGQRFGQSIKRIAANPEKYLL